VLSLRLRLALAGAAVIGGVGVAYATRPRPVVTPVEPFRLGRTTSADDMAETVAVARRRLAANPADAEAAITLADVLMRQGRVERHGAHGAEAEAALRPVLREEPDNYPVIRMLGVALLSQHKFRDAAATAARAIELNKSEAANYGVLGDAQLELGEYDQAFDAFDRMAAIRPDATSYARIAYAHELQGRLDEALVNMQRAATATGAQDPEALAWHYAQMGHLYLEQGDVAAAAREFARAGFAFPDHPYARLGLARVATARQDYRGALAMYQALLVTGPTAEMAAAAGDLMAVTGDAAGAAAMYAKAETLERESWTVEQPHPAGLARMLAGRNLKTTEAVALAEQGAAARADIFTLDALAVAYWRAGRLDEAAQASGRALRTGSRDRRLLYHAAAIAEARGARADAKRLLSRMPRGRNGDALLAREIEALAAKL
jgi:tetratricopeptide (TPR) repeat protein